MTSINDIEFYCPVCGRKHNLLEWASSAKLDTEWVLENLSEDGVIRLSFPYVQCDCDAEYIVDISPGYVEIYDDSNELVFDAGFTEVRK